MQWTLKNSWWFFFFFFFNFSCSSYGWQDRGWLRVRSPLTTLAGVHQHWLSLLWRFPHQWSVDHLCCPLLAEVCNMCSVACLLYPTWILNIILPAVCVLVRIHRLPSWATTTSGFTRAPSSTCRWTPFTGTSSTTTGPWTMTSCYWSWHTLSRKTNMSGLLPCPKAAQQLEKCAPCQDGGTFTPMMVRCSTDLKIWHLTTIS